MMDGPVNVIEESDSICSGHDHDVSQLVWNRTGHPVMDRRAWRMPAVEIRGRPR